MRKIIASAMAAATLLAGLGMGSTASAEWRGHYYRHDHDAGAAVAAGIAGLAVGAAIAGSHPGYYYRDYDDDDYYGPYGYDYGRRCRSWVTWNPWTYSYVRHTRCW